ncbi:MAG: fatty acyl-AMP ligase [Thermoanaerobaculia bacterium]|nr:fatty acyl-AMP ligase [Thermoanaerobaculia bacterium]
MIPTLVEALERARGAEEAGLRLLDRHEEPSWKSWGEVYDGAMGTAGGLASLGVRPGDRVALVFPTCWGFFDAFFGALLAGAVPVPLYPPVRLGRLDEYHRATGRMIEAAGARLVVCDRRVERLLGESVRRGRPALGCRSLERIPRHDGVEAARPRLDDLALVQFSSGTTVDPKPVALDHRAVMSQVVSLNSFWPDEDDTRHSGVSWLPLYHDMGLIGCVFAALERPAVLTLIPPELFVARPAVWLRAIGRYRATVSPAPNFAYGLCVEKIRDEELDGVELGSWRVALNGAETVSPRVMREFCQRFSAWGFRRRAMTPVYGLSEAALAVTFSSPGSEFQVRRLRADRLGAGDRVEPDPGGIEIASVGRPLPGGEIEIRRADGTAAPEGEVGRLWVRGPSLMQGYLGRLEETARVLVDGWLDTGDLGFLLDGELHLAGRAKEIVIVRGRNYAPEHLERAADRLPGVRRGCVVAVSTPVDAGTERVLLFVERDRRATDEEIASVPERIRERVLAATGLAPDEIHLLEPGTLPRTSSGKLRRGETLERHLAGSLAAPEGVGPVFLLRQLVKSRLAFWRGALAGGRDA